MISSTNLCALKRDGTVHGTAVPWTEYRGTFNNAHPSEAMHLEGSKVRTRVIWHSLYTFIAQIDLIHSHSSIALLSDIKRGSSCFAKYDKINTAKNPLNFNQN